MIPQIGEYHRVNGVRVQGLASYATLHQATVSLQEMGDRTISTQVKIDGDIVPDFDGWELEFKGERFVLPVKEPQAAKDNTTRNSIITLNFQSWAIQEMKRYFFMSLSQIQANTAIPDQYVASVTMPLEEFVELFNGVLQYYFGNKIRMDLFGQGTGIYSTTPIAVEIDYTYIWDVLTKFNELFDIRWRLEYDSVNDAQVIKVGYPADTIDDHDFEYGYQGGLLKFERQVQDETVNNVLLGRGGEKNVPYRYFKRVDPQNPSWAPDPDAIYELKDIYFDRIRDANFRWYIRGWMQNSDRDHTWENESPAYVYPTYTESDCPEECLFAFRKGKTDTNFNPVEYVKDDESIEKYGERWGALENNEDIFPTIQGVDLPDDNPDVGRVDEVVAVSDIITDDIYAASQAAATENTIGGNLKITRVIAASGYSTDVLTSEEFYIPSGKIGDVEFTWLDPMSTSGASEFVTIDTDLSNLVAVNSQTGQELPLGGLTTGYYRIKATIRVNNASSSMEPRVTYGLSSLKVVISEEDTESWKPTFDIWVKNIWETYRRPGETDAQYSERVWVPILGDRLGNEARVVFSDGFMSISEDYEFPIVSLPVPDQSKEIRTTDEHGNPILVASEWKITLRKSDAEYDATGLFIPNATTGGKPVAGDHFFFIGIDMPNMYVTIAERRLNAFKSNELEGLSEINPVWVIGLDKVRVHTLEDEDYGTLLADRLSAGCTINTVDPRFTDGLALTLYVQSLTYTWNEGDMVPNIDVVLSDKVLAVSNPIGKLNNEVQQVRSTYAKTSDIETVVRRVASSLFLKKTGEEDESTSPTRFSSKVSSRNFRQGDLGGAGWGHYEDGDGNAVLELDKLIVRKEMQVNELVANQITYVGGKQIISAASIVCSQVLEDDNYYYCYFDQKQGSVANLFQVGDFAMGQDFDPSNAELRYYRARVEGVDVDYIKLSKTTKDGQGAPQEGDVIVQYGNDTVSARQYVIIRDVIGGGYERMLSGLTTVSSAGNEYYFAGRQSGQNPRWFVGDAAGEFAKYENGQLSIKGRVSVMKSDGSYQAMSDYIESLNYLVEATNNGTTLIDGGLILSNIIALGKTVNQQFSVWAGINGLRDTSETGNGIAAWFGGEMLEKSVWDAMTSAEKALHEYARSLFRFDGSGYLASGRIGWQENGAGFIPGISWTADNKVVIGANVYLEDVTGDTVTELVQLVRQITSWFGEDASGNVYVRKRTVGGSEVARNFYSYGAVTAGGIGSGGSTPTTLAAVWASLTGNTGDYANTTINPAHIPVASTSAIGGVKVDGTTITISNGVISAVGGGGSGYLPLTGGTMTGDIKFADDMGLVNANDYNVISADGNVIIIGAAAMTGLHLRTNATDLLHYRGNTSYKIWDAYNLARPASKDSDDLVVASGFYCNDDEENYWLPGSAPSTGTPTVLAVRSDLSNYLPLTGGTLTGDLRLPVGGALSFGNSDLVYIGEDTTGGLYITAYDGVSIGAATAISGSLSVNNGTFTVGSPSSNRNTTLNGELSVLKTLRAQYGIVSSADIYIAAGQALYLDTAGDNEIFYDTVAGEIKFYFDSGVNAHFDQGIISDSFITAGTAASVSDRKLKDNIEAIHSDRALSVLSQLKPCEWDWNESNPHLYGQRGAGLVAQDVQDVLPFAVLEGEHLALNYNVLHAYEIAGWQNHEARIAALEAENKELKRRLSYVE